MMLDVRSLFCNEKSDMDSCNTALEPINNE